MKNCFLGARRLYMVKKFHFEATSQMDITFKAVLKSMSVLRVNIGQIWIEGTIQTQNGTYYELW